jgi:hypothetical protein
MIETLQDIRRQVGGGPRPYCFRAGPPPRSPETRRKLIMTACWQAPGSSVLTPEVQKMLIDSVHAEVGSRSIAELEAERDEILLGLLELRTRRPKTGAPHEVAAE